MGDKALAAVGNMSSLSFLIMGFSMGLAMSSFTSQNYGAKRYDRIREGNEIY